MAGMADDDDESQSLLDPPRPSSNTRSLTQVNMFRDDPRVGEAQDPAAGVMTQVHSIIFYFPGYKMFEDITHPWITADLKEFQNIPEEISAKERLSEGRRTHLERWTLQNGRDIDLLPFARVEEGVPAKRLTRVAQLIIAAFEDEMKTCNTWDLAYKECVRRFPDGVYEGYNYPDAAALNSRWQFLPEPDSQDFEALEMQDKQLEQEYGDTQDINQYRFAKRPTPRTSTPNDAGEGEHGSGGTGSGKGASGGTSKGKGPAPAATATSNPSGAAHAAGGGGSDSDDDLQDIFRKKPNEKPAENKKKKSKKASDEEGAANPSDRKRQPSSDVSEHGSPSKKKRTRETKADLEAKLRAMEHENKRRLDEERERHEQEKRELEEKNRRAIAEAMEQATQRHRQLEGMTNQPSTIMEPVVILHERLQMEEQQRELARQEAAAIAESARQEYARKKKATEYQEWQTRHNQVVTAEKSKLRRERRQAEGKDPDAESSDDDDDDEDLEMGGLNIWHDRTVQLDSPEETPLPSPSSAERRSREAMPPPPRVDVPSTSTGVTQQISRSRSQSTTRSSPTQADLPRSQSQDRRRTQDDSRKQSCNLPGEPSCECESLNQTQLRGALNRHIPPHKLAHMQMWHNELNTRRIMGKLYTIHDRSMDTGKKMDQALKTTEQSLEYSKTSAQGVQYQQQRMTDMQKLNLPFKTYNDLVDALEDHEKKGLLEKLLGQVSQDKDKFLRDYMTTVFDVQLLCRMYPNRTKKRADETPFCYGEQYFEMPILMQHWVVYHMTKPLQINEKTASNKYVRLLGQFRKDRFAQMHNYFKEHCGGNTYPDVDKVMWMCYHDTKMKLHFIDRPAPIWSDSTQEQKKKYWHHFRTRFAERITDQYDNFASLGKIPILTRQLTGLALKQPPQPSVPEPQWDLDDY